MCLRLQPKSKKHRCSRKKTKLKRMILFCRQTKKGKKKI